MVSLTCYIKTNISNTFFSNRDDENDFYDWVNHNLYTDKLTDIEIELPIEGIDGITKVTMSINEFNADHDLDLSVEVETTLSEDEVADSDALPDFMEKEAVPKFISEFNSKCDLAFPMTSTEDFDDMIFDGENFFVRTSIVSGKPDSTKLVVLQATDDFDVYL